MERWSVAKCRSRDGAKYYLANKSRTVITIAGRARNFDLERLLTQLREVGFPLRFTNGLQQINFSILEKGTFGEYVDDEIWVDVRKKHRFKTLVETFVHEVAHHVDCTPVRTVSYELHNERKRRGQRIHNVAQRSDDEYFARGFERFYSIDPQDKRDLRKNNPRLYREISRLHRRYKSR